MPRTPEYGPEYEYHSQQAATKEDIPTFKAEPVLLYIKTGLGRYELVDRTFSSRNEARRFAEETYGDTPVKVLTQSEALSEAKRQAERAEKIQRTKERVVSGAKAAVTGTREGVKKFGEKAHEYHERLETAERRRLEREEAEEERALERERLAIAREKLKIERERLMEKRKAELEKLKGEREALKSTRPKSPYYPESKPAGTFHVPNIWQPSTGGKVMTPGGPRHTINPPPPMTTSRPLSLQTGPSPSRLNPPNIWDPHKSKKKDK